MLLLTQIQKIVPAAPTKRLEQLLPYFNTYLPFCDIVTGLRVAAFIAQVAHESDSFNALEEYASGAAYEGRKDLGNNQPGDGKRFKGRGLIQVTGRANYTQFSQDMLQGDGFVKHPELLAQPVYAVQSACWFWKNRNLNELADKADMIGITRKINGGLNHLKERLAFYNKAKKVLNIK